ncbi:Nipped-B-like protein, partial [Araneus ventricosus]
MMNGPSVPIITLAGVQSLTDLLLELPLPTPRPGVTGQQSLLSHLSEPEDARRLLNTQESSLTPSLTNALAHTSTGHIEVKDGYYGGGALSGQVSQLMQYLLSTNPGLFKGSLQGHQNRSADHPPVQPSNSAVHSQSHAFSASASSPCQPHPAQDSSPHFFPLEHPPTPQGARIVQNRTQSAVPPVAYSPYADPVVSSGQHQIAPLHHNVMNQGTTDSLSSDLQEIFHSSLLNQTSPAGHPFMNGNCVDEVNLSAVNAEQSNRTENQMLNTAQVIGGLTPNCSVLLSPLNKPNDIALSSSSTVTQHINSSNVTPGPSASQMQQWQNVPSNSNDVSQSDSISKANASVMNNGMSTSVAGNDTQPSSLPELVNENQIVNHVESVEENGKAFSPGKGKVAEPVVILSKVNIEEAKGKGKNASSSTKSNDKQKATTDPEVAPSKVNNQESKGKGKNSSPPDVSNDKIAAGPMVVLSKLSVEDQLLAEKSVKQFIKKKKLSVPEPVQKPSQNKNSETNNQRRKSTSKEPEISKSSPSKRGRNSEQIFSSRKNSEGVKERGTKRSSSVLDNKVNNNASTSGERVKRRKKQVAYIESSGSEDEKDDKNDDDDDYKDESPSKSPVATSSTKVKKVKNKRVKKEEPMSIEDLMDSNTYQHFSRIVDTIFDSMADVDFAAAIDEDAECATEVLIPLHQLQELSNEAAKLKRLHAMNQFPPERLVRLLAILERNIIDGAKLLPVQSMEDQDEEEARLWLELTMERVMRSADASLTALYVMTSKDMPEKVFLEDVIERIVVFLKFQLQNTVFPVFDPAYRLDPKSKDGYAGNIKQKRAHAHKVKEKSTLQLYNKLHESVRLLSELLELQTLTDTIILQVSTLGVSPFFVEGISELQLNSLHLVTTVFSRYDKHRQLILEDILASIARLPTSKRSLRNYRLNSEENIQMLTALVLQLIHSVVKLPEPESPRTEDSLNEDRPKLPETKEKVYVDKDVLITMSYEASVTTAVNFLSVFLRKCGTKNEEMDYRPLFENFVQDLLSTVNKPEWPASELLLSLLGRILVKNFSNKSMEMTLRVASLDYLGVVAARLRKDAVSSQDRKDMINDVIQRIVSGIDDTEKSPSKHKKKNKNKPVKRDEAQILQKALLQYLDTNAANDPALQFSRRFYIAQWYRDAATEIKRSDKCLNFSSKEESDKSEPSTPKSKSRPSRSGTPARRSSNVIQEEDEE